MSYRQEIVGILLLGAPCTLNLILYISTNVKLRIALSLYNLFKQLIYMF